MSSHGTADRPVRVAVSRPAHLESTALGRHLIAAGDPAHARALIGAAAVMDLPTDGTTDVAPLIQAAYDAGAQMVQLTSGITYAWNSPVFLDNGGQLGGFVIEGNRARIKLGGGLPKSNWLRDTTTRFAIFPNTNRTALSGGVVTVSSATRSSGTDVGAVRPLTLRNAIIDGNGTNAGFSFANRAGVTMDQVTLWRARVAVTWSDYSDGNTFLNCYSRYGGAPSSQAMVEQVAPGDGIVIVGGKADTPVAFARLKGCRGAAISGLVTARLVFEECDAIHVAGSHFEGQASPVAMVTMKSSRVTFANCAFYETYDATVGCISIDDGSSTVTATDLTLMDCTSMQLVTSGTPDAMFSALVMIATARAGTRVTARGLQGRQASSTAPGRWRDTAQPTFDTGDDDDLRASLDADAGGAVMASGDFQVRRSATGWAVTPSDTGPIASRRQSAAPAITQVTSSASSTMGALVAGSVYGYLCAVRDALGNWSAASAVASGMPGTTKILGLDIAVADAPGVLVIWRGISFGVATTADRYVVLPVRAGLVSVYDTGSRIGGRPWITSGIPDPTSVATVNSTVDALLVGATVVR